MQEIVSAIVGDLSPAGRIWTSLLPALLIAAYFVLGLAIYGVRTLLYGPWRDPEVEGRGSSFLLGMGLRTYFVWVTRPVWLLLCRSGLPPRAVTTLSVLLSGGAGVALAAGRFALGGWLFLFAGICDFFDGRLARATGRTRPSGAALDSILDRYSEAMVFIGLAWYYRESWVLLPVLLAMMGSTLVPYVRARGEALGVADVKGGTMQRPERVLYLGVAVAFSPIIEVWLNPADPHPPHRLAVLGMLLLAVTTQLTAAWRFSHLLGQLGEPSPLRGCVGTGRASLVRVVIASVLATGCDFLLFYALMTWGGLPPWLATAPGRLLGAAVNYTINNVFSFNGRELPWQRTASRYALVSFSSALLDSGGMAILLLIPGLDPRLAWVLVHGAVFLAWSYPLLREYVFSSLGFPLAETPNAGSSGGGR